MGPTQLLYIASEIALAFLVHPVAAASLCGDFFCERHAGTNRDAE